MLETRLDAVDFRPVFPLFRLLLACAAFGSLGLLSALETRNAFKYGLPITPGFVAERAGIAAMILLGFSLVVAHLLLPLRLRFTEAGLVRRTIFGPRFVPWPSVTRARLSGFKGGVWLELDATARRLPLLVPLMEYRRPASLLAELRRRLPVEVQDPAGQLAARLTDD